MEASSISNSNPVSRRYLCFGFIRQLLHLGSTIKWSDSFYNHVVCRSNVVRNLLPTCIHWILLWIPQTTLRATRPHQSNSKTSPDTNLVHASSSLHPRCWRFTIWCMLHRTILHIFCHLREPILLPFWISVFGIHHFGGFMQSDKVSFRLNTEHNLSRYNN